MLRLNVAVVQKEAKPGDVPEAIADCPTFAQDLKTWCATMKNVFIKRDADGPSTIAHVQI